MLDYTSGVTAVGATATLIATIPAVADGILLTNTGTGTVYLGNASVTTTTGFPVAANATVTVPTVGNYPRNLYGVVASGTASVAFLTPTNPQ